MAKIFTKNEIGKLSVYKIKRDINAWKKLAGIWKNKRIGNPIQWQRKIRKEWGRKIL